MDVPPSLVHAIEVVGTFISAYDIAGLVVAFLAALGSALLFLWFLLRHQVRLFRNLKKRLLFVNLTDDHRALEMEADLLTNGRLFSAPRVIHDPRIIDNTDIAQYSLLVVGVDQNTESTRFKDVYTKIAALGKPVLIYTLGNRSVPFLHEEGYIKNYPRHTVVTTPIRLVGDIFTVLSAFPNK